MSPAYPNAGLIPFVHARFASSQKTSMRGARGGNSRRGGSFGVLLDPHLGNSEGEADAALRLVRLHGVAGGEQEGQRLPDGGVEDNKRRGEFQRHGGGIPAFVGRLLHEADVGDQTVDFSGSFPQSGEPGHGGGGDHFHGKYSFLSKQFYSRL